MALQRYTAPVDGTIPVQALLYTDEQRLASQEGVGIYDGLQKSPPHQSGTIYTTSHRLIYIDNKEPEFNSFALDLGYVSQTDYYAGLFTSSPKVTLYLIGKSGNASNASSSTALSISGFSGVPDSGLWECDVCGNKNRNFPGQSPTSTQVCELCGVPRSSTQHSTQQLSTSLPSSSIHQPTHMPQSSSSQSRRPSSIACPACTFLNHPSLIECEICGTQLPTSSADTQPLARSAPATRAGSPDSDDDDDDPSGGKLMKVSFRKGGDKGFYTILKRSLRSKAWESRAAQLYKSTPPVSSEIEGNAITKSGITILAGILRSVETSAQGSDADLKNALQDLEALMIKARDMVHLAGELNEKLTVATSTISSATTPPRTPTPTLSSQSPLPLSNTTQSSLTLTSTNNGSQSFNKSSSSSYELPEEATFIRSSLSQLGLQMTNVPVTNDMIKDENKWLNELARELGEVLRGMMRDRGIIALDEVWGGWNRARGVALLPPSTLLLVIPHLPNYTSPPIHTRTFIKSGLSVLHTPPYTQDAFVRRLTNYLNAEGSKTTMEVAMNEGGGLTVALVREMIDEAEMNGDVLRDDVECVIQRDEGEGDENREGEGEEEEEGGVSWANASRGGFALGVGEAGVRWWPNVFVGYAWDGQTFHDDEEGR